MVFLLLDFHKVETVKELIFSTEGDHIFPFLFGEFKAFGALRSTQLGPATSPASFVRFYLIRVFRDLCHHGTITLSLSSEGIVISCFGVMWIQQLVVEVLYL